jgi:hypothetical protein
MSYIPSGAKWYVAELVEETTVEGDVRNVVHKNLVLVSADSPNNAYERACELGRQSETAFDNPAGAKVAIRFRGIAYLNVVHDRLEHGAELLFSENIGMSEADVVKLVVPKDRLAVFRPTQSSDGPDYSSQEIVDEAIKIAGSSDEAGI